MTIISNFVFPIVFIISGLVGIALVFIGPYQEGPATPRDWNWRLATVFFLILHPLLTVYALAGQIGWQPLNWIMLALAIVDLFLLNGIQALVDLFYPHDYRIYILDRYWLGNIVAGLYGMYLVALGAHMFGFLL